MSARLYSVYGLTLESAEPFPELTRIDSGTPDLRIRWANQVDIPRAAQWSVLWRWPETGEAWVTVARAGVERLFRFARYLDVHLSGAQVTLTPRGFTRPITARHLFLDQALPLVLAARGHLVLHASALAIHGRGVLLAGVAGAGKSTLAALIAGGSHALLADDGVMVEEGGGGLRVAPSYPGLRLFEDSAALTGMPASGGAVAEYTTKQRFVHPAPEADAAPRLPLGAVYVLESGDAPEPRISRLSPRDAVMAVVEHAYRDDVTDGEMLRAQLDRISRWVAAGWLDAWRVEFPRVLADAPRVAAAIADHASRRVHGARRSNPI